MLESSKVQGPGLLILSTLTHSCLSACTATGGHTKAKEPCRAKARSPTRFCCELLPTLPVSLTTSLSMGLMRVLTALGQAALMLYTASAFTPLRAHAKARTLHADSSDLVPRPPRINVSRGLLQGAFALVGGLFATQTFPNPFAMATGFPIKGDESIMKKKGHGTSDFAVQKTLRWGVDVQLADRICNYNRHYAEASGSWRGSELYKQITTSPPNGPISFYDSVTGKELFRAPVGRTLNEFIAESNVHGWPSFRDSEVVWDNVRCLRDGETVSLSGTHLGHNLPDFSGNRYCINLVSVAGNPV